MVMLQREHISLIVVMFMFLLISYCFFSGFSNSDYQTDATELKTQSQASKLLNLIKTQLSIANKHSTYVPPISLQESIAAFNLLNKCPVVSEEKIGVCFWRHKFYYSNYNDDSKEISIWRDPKEVLPLLEVAFKYADSKNFFKIAAGINPKAHFICKSVYKEKCTADFLIDIDRHVRGIEHTKLPYMNGEFIPTKKATLPDVFLSLHNLIGYIYKHIYSNAENFLSELCSLRKSSEIFKTQTCLFFAINYVMLMMIYIVCKFFFSTWAYICNIILTPIFNMFMFVTHLVFYPLRFFFYPLSFVFFPILPSVTSLWKSCNIKETKRKVEKGIDTESLSLFECSSQSKSLSKYTGKIDSAFIERAPIKETISSSAAIRKYGYGTNFQGALKNIPYFSPLTIQELFMANVHLSLGVVINKDPAKELIRYFQHKTFASNTYYIVPDNVIEKDRLAVGCSVYHVQCSAQNKDYIVHIYPRSYAGSITCWEFDPQFDNEKGLRTIDVISTNQFLIQVTDIYNYNYMTVAENLKNPYAVRPDWNLYKNESFYWGFLYYVLPGVESALLQRCSRGHLDIVYSEDLSFRIRCIRRKSESDEDDMELLQSYNQLLDGLLNGIETLTRDKFSQLFISTVHHLLNYSNQYKAVVTVWHIASIVQDKIMSAIAEGNHAGFDFDNVPVPSFSDAYHYLEETHIKDRNEWEFLDGDLPDYFSNQEVQILQHEPPGLICRRKLH